MAKSSNPKLKSIPLSALFYALSDPLRLGIIRCLIEKEEISCGEFTCSVSKSTLSHHFKVLREAGLIQKREQGTRQFNSLRREEIEERFPGLLAAILNCRGPW